MAEENVNTSAEKPTSIDKPKVSVNPITGLPFGGATINPETNTIDTNPITGKKFGLGLVNSEGKANYGSYSPSFPTLGGKGFSPSNIFTDTYTMYNQKPMEDYKKYGVPMGRHFDWDELRARNQTAGETILHGAGKALVTFGGALLENTIGFFAGLGEMATGGAYYDNAIGKTVDKWNAWAEEAMPTYITKEEQDYSTWQKMGTAHFWADDVLGGMSYTAAAAASIYLTGGGGILTKGAKAVTTAAFSRMALYNTTKAVINGTKLTKDLVTGAQFTNRLWNAAAVLEAGAMMSLAEASVESRETQKNTYNTLIENYLQENKTSNIDNIPKHKLKEFEDISYNAGNTNFVMQMPVLMGTNLLMFGRSVSGFKVGSSINKDVLWNTATSSYASKLADKGFMSATLSKLKPVAVQGLNEAFQESYQFGSSAFASSYHIDKYNNNGNADISKALADGWDAMGTQEGVESALIGFITGGFFGGARGISSKQYSNRVEKADRLAGLLNGGEMLNAASMYQGANAESAASERMEMHLQNGNIKGYQDSRFELIAAQSLEMLERGGLELYIDQLQESANLTDAEFKKLYGYLETDKHGDPISVEQQSNGKNQHEVIDGIVKKVRQFQQTYNDVNDKFSLPERTTGLPRLLMSEEKRAAEDKVYNDTANLRNELILSAAGVRDRNRRMSNIQNTIQNTADDMYLYNRDARGETISMTEVLSEQQPEHEGVQKWKEPGIKEKQDAFSGEQIGVDEQGNPIYSPGVKIDPNALLENQKIEAQPDRYNPNVQLLETQLKLKEVEDKIRRADPLAADKVADLNKDYMELLSENNYAIERYNQLSSDQYAQKQWTEALNSAISEKQQKNADQEAIKKTQEAKTAKDIMDYTDITPGISPEVQAQMQERFEQLKKDENDAYQKYYKTAKTKASTAKEQLKILEDIDQSTLNESEKEGIRKAINVITQQLQTEKMKNQSDEVTEEDIEVEETKKEIEEELAPENVGGVESISENGREFQIEGTQYYNREENPSDAIIEEGGIITIKLQNEQGDTHFIKAPQARVMALYYAILASEQYKVDSTQGIARQDILDRSETIIEESTRELKPSVKNSAKNASALRSEIYGLERSVDELIEVHDQLRTSLIQDDSATKEDIKKNLNIKALNNQIKKVKSAITKRKNVLLNRKESVTPTIAEITAVEKKSINDVSQLTSKLEELHKQSITAEETVKRTEALMEQYQNDPASFQQVSKENDDAKNKVNELEEEIKKLYTLIEYKKQKLRRLENEKQNRPPESPEQTTPEDTGKAEKPITEGENPNTTTVPQEERVTVAANLGYQRVNSNSYVINPTTGSFTRIKNATETSIPGHSEVEAFTYKDQNGDILVVDSLTGTELGRNKNAKLAGKQAVEALNQGTSTDLFKGIIDQTKKVSPAYEPINTIEEKENFTNSEKRTEKVLTIENGKAKIVKNTPAPGPGQRGGMVVMTQAEVEAYDKEQAKDLSEGISETSSSNSLINKTSEKQRLELLEETLQEKHKKVLDLMREKGKEQSMLETFIRNKAKETSKGNELLTNFQMEDILSNPENYSEAVVVNAMKRHLLGVGPINTGNSERRTREMIPEIKQEIEEGIPLNKSEYDSKLLGTIAFQYPYKTGRDLAKGQTRYAYEKLIEEGIIKPTQPTTAAPAVPVANIEKVIDKNLVDKPEKYPNDTIDSNFGQNWNTGKYSLSDIQFLANEKNVSRKLVGKRVLVPTEGSKAMYDYLTSLNPSLKNIKAENEDMQLDVIRGIASGLNFVDIKYFVEDLKGTATNQSKQDSDLSDAAVEAYLKREGTDKASYGTNKIGYVLSPETAQRVIDNTETPVEPIAPVEPVEQQIKKSEYEVHVTGDITSGWDMSKYMFNVPGIKIRDLRFPRKGSEQEKAKQRGERTYDTSVQNGKKIFTIVDHSLARGGRAAALAASMVFDENTSHTLEDVKGNLNAVMDSLMGVKDKYQSQFTLTNVNFDWMKLNIKEIATPSVIQEESAPKAKNPIVKTIMDTVTTKDSRNNPETFKPWFLDAVSDSNDVKGTAKEITKLREIGKNLDNKNTNWKWGDLRADVDGRPMISVDIVETGESFIMYKSKSENVWVPIPGFAKNGWFVKSYWNKESPKINKYDIETFKDIATMLEVLGEDLIPISKSKATSKSKVTFMSNLSLGLANDTKNSPVERKQGKFNIPVNDQGLPQSYLPDMLNGDPIVVDKSILLDPNILDKEVEFELVINDWFKKDHGEFWYPNNTNDNVVPIYVKIDGVKIGKLESSDKGTATYEERKALVEKLQAGEKVITKINEIMTNNFNHAKTEDGKSWFFNPNDVMGNGQSLLVFTKVNTEDQISLPYWVLSEDGTVAESKDQGDLGQIKQDVSSFDKESAKVNFGQVGIIIRPKNNPQGISRIAMGSTQNLTPTAIKAVITSLQNKNHNRASNIVSSNYMRQGADTDTFLEFDVLPDGTNVMIYKSPKLDKLVRINEHELAKALSGKTAKSGFVETHDPGTGFLEYRPLPADQIDNTDSDYINDNFKQDFENFLIGKKYHIDRTLGNTVSPYVSPVYPENKYNSYQEYLFAEREIGGEREVGFGHNSIFATDLIKTADGSFFNNPKITFSKGDLNGNTAETITNPVKPVRDIRPSEETALEKELREMGLSEEDGIIPDCP